MLMGWLEVESITGEATTSCLITAFNWWFRRLGIPQDLSCNGEQTSPDVSPEASLLPDMSNTLHLF